jgi:hypothetical protein
MSPFVPTSTPSTDVPQGEPAKASSSAIRTTDNSGSATTTTGGGADSTSEQPSNTPTLGFSSASAASGPNNGAIVGGVVGAVVFIVLVCLGFVIVRRARRRRTTRAISSGFWPTFRQGSTPESSAHPFYHIDSNDATSAGAGWTFVPGQLPVDRDAAIDAITAQIASDGVVGNNKNLGTFGNMQEATPTVLAKPKRTRVSTTSEKSLNPTVISQMSWWAQ